MSPKVNTDQFRLMVFIFYSFQIIHVLFYRTTKFPVSPKPWYLVSQGE